MTLSSITFGKAQFVPNPKFKNALGGSSEQKCYDDEFKFQEIFTGTGSHKPLAPAIAEAIKEAPDDIKIKAVFKNYKDDIYPAKEGLPETLQLIAKIDGYKPIELTTPVKVEDRAKIINNLVQHEKADKFEEHETFNPNFIEKFVEGLNKLKRPERLAKETNYKPELGLYKSMKLYG